MGTKHYIFGDTHHGSGEVVKYLRKKAKKQGKLSVSSTGDFFNYAANKRSPKQLKHPWVDAYKKGDKKAMKKHTPDWVRTKVIPYTRRSGRQFQELKPHLKGGKINTIMGNSDYAVERVAGKHGAANIQETLGGKKSAVSHTQSIQVKKDGKTTFVYLPHDAALLSRYQNLNYGEAKTRLEKDSAYRDKLKGVKDRIGRYGSKNIVVLMHEAPKPERWYGKGSKKAKKRLPDPLKAHYDSVLEQIVKGKDDKNIHIFHGHLHESDRKRYKYKGVKTRLLDIGDIISYDTKKGTYRTRRVKPKLSLVEGGESYQAAA